MLLMLLHRDFVIRGLGLGLLAVAIFCFDVLFTGPATHGAGGWPAALEAATGFLGASLGTAMLLLGRHINDGIAVSARWARVRPGATISR